MKNKTLIEASCKDCKDFSFAYVSNRIINREYQSTELLDENILGENFMSLLVWWFDKKLESEQVHTILNILANLNSIEKLDIMKPNKDGDTFLHYLLDEDNMLSKKNKKKIVEEFFRDMPLDHKLTILNIKDNNESAEPFNINFDNYSENLGHLIAYAISEDLLISLFTPEELSSMNEENAKLWMLLMDSVDEDEESLNECLTDEERNELVHPYILKKANKLSSNKNKNKIKGKKNELR